MLINQNTVKSMSIKELVKEYFNLETKDRSSPEHFYLVKELLIRVDEPDWKNAIPVVVPLIKVVKDNQVSGLLGIIRGDNPQKGKVAFPGGFQEEEDVKTALHREIFEETGMDLIKMFGTEDLWEEEIIIKSTPDGRRNLMFFRCKYHLKHEDIAWDFKNPENDGFVLVRPGQEMAFPLHQAHIEWGLK